MMTTDYKVTHIPTGESEICRVYGKISHLFVSTDLNSNHDNPVKNIAFQFNNGQYVDVMICKHLPWTTLADYTVEEHMSLPEEKVTECCGTCNPEPEKESECTGTCGCHQQERPECLYEHIPNTAPKWVGYVIPILVGLGVLWLVTSF